MCQKWWESGVSSRSCLILTLASLLESVTFLKSVRQGMWSHRGVQLDACSSTPASSWEVKRWLWSGSWSVTWVQHHATPGGAKLQQNLGSWSAPGHVIIVLEANCLDWQSKTWEERAPHLPLLYSANTRRFSQLLCISAVFTALHLKHWLVYIHLHSKLGGI